MKPFRTYIPVLEEEFQRLKEQRIKEYNPKLRVQAFLETEVADILNNAQLSDSDKLRVLHLAMNRVESLQNKEGAQPKIAGLESALPVAVLAPNQIPNEGAMHLPDPAQAHVGVADPSAARSMGRALTRTTGIAGQETASSSEHRRVAESESEQFFDADSKPAEHSFQSMRSLVPSLVPRERVHQAEELIDHMNRLEGISVGPNYQLHLHGEPVKGVFLLDVINKLYQRSSLSPDQKSEIEPFIHFAKEASIPASILCKREVQSAVKRMRLAPLKPAAATPTSWPFTFSTMNPALPTESSGRKRKLAKPKSVRVLHVY